MYKVLEILTLMIVISTINCLPLGGGILEAITGNSEPAEETVYETQNVYGTIGAKQRQIAINNGLRPVVDTLEEHEKYGNDGGIQRAVGKVFITKTEGLESAITNAIQFPQTQKQAALKSLTAALNRVGHSIVGL